MHLIILITRSTLDRMLGLDPTKNQIIADICATPLVGGRVVTLLDTKAADIQVLGELMINAASMLTREMASGDPMISSLIRSSSRMAREGLDLWSELPVSEQGSSESYEDWIHRRYVSLEAALSTALGQMSAAAEMARAGGTYSLFRRAIIEQTDRVIAATSEGRLTGLLSFDRFGLRVEARGGADLLVVRDYVRSKYELTADDLYLVSVNADDERLVAAGSRVQAVSLALAGARDRGELESVCVKGPDDAGSLEFTGEGLEAMMTYVTTFEATSELPLDARVMAHANTPFATAAMVR